MRRNGFTLIEVLIIVVMIGILLTLVFQKFRGRTSTDGTTTLRADLRNAKAAETAYFTVHNMYGTLAQLDSARLFSAAPGNSVTLMVTPTGYTATSTSGASQLTCTLTVTGGAAGTEPACN
jgi:prepilin-type N-terminal cleavage/methylation domain-containing protein